MDNETNFSISVASAAGRAAIGGLLAGGVGAIIGGATSSKKGSSIVKYMQLTISTSDLNNPYTRIVVLKDKNGVKRDSSEFRKNMMMQCIGVNLLKRYPICINTINFISFLHNKRHSFIY